MPFGVSVGLAVLCCVMQSVQMRAAITQLGEHCHPPRPRLEGESVQRGLSTHQDAVGASGVLHCGALSYRPPATLTTRAPVSPPPRPSLTPSVRPLRCPARLCRMSRATPWADAGRHAQGALDQPAPSLSPLHRSQDMFFFALALFPMHLNCSPSPVPPVRTCR